MSFEIPEYNKTLFETMRQFVDAVWILNTKTQEIYFPYDRIIPEQEGIFISFAELSEKLSKIIPEDTHKQHMSILNPNNVKSLKKSITFPGKILNDGVIHELKCIITPDSTDCDEETKIAYISFQDIHNIVQREAMLKSSIEKERYEHDSLQSIASIYDTMHILDLENGTFEERNTDQFVHNILELNIDAPLQQKLWSVMRNRFSGSNLDSILDFTNLSTLEKRLENTNYISTELTSIGNNWYRLAFIRIGNNSEKLSKVIITSQNIDKEKRKEETLIRLTQTDKLTQLYNRYAYECDISILETGKIKDDLCFMEVDLNDLKKNNDLKGHKAGDEIIKAVADCLNIVVSPFGRVYRIGGDEFTCIFNASDKEVVNILKQLEEYRSSWSGEFSNTFTFSKGLVCASEIKNCTISDLEKLADSRMYADKRNYYMNNGDRRKR